MSNISGIGVAALAAVCALLAVGHALLHKRRPESAFGWIAVCLIFPFAGALLYFLFGINRIRTRAKKLRSVPYAEPSFAAASAPPSPELEPLVRLGSAVSEFPLVDGNRIETLHNGERAFPAMLDAIGNASQSVYLSTYIFESNETGRRFVTALHDAAARGLDVRVLLDGIGEQYAFPRVRHRLRRGGVRVARFLPPRLIPPAIHVNLRNHRKILAIDGSLAFTGGMNIGDRHLAERTSNRNRVIDVHFALQGPVADSIQSIFLNDWALATGETTSPPPASARWAGTAKCRAVADGPDEDIDKLSALIMGAISAARKRVSIMTPYFLPQRELIGALRGAALRGVDVAIVLPRRNNLPYVHRATRHMLWELLENGVHIYYRPGPFAHAKLLLVDEEYAQIGSANIDPRSLRLNFELMVEVYDRAFVDGLGRHFEATRARSHPITLSEVEGRPLATRLLDGLAWLFTPYL